MPNRYQGLSMPSSLLVLVPYTFIHAQQPLETETAYPLKIRYDIKPNFSLSMGVSRDNTGATLFRLGFTYRFKFPGFNFGGRDGRERP